MRRYWRPPGIGAPHYRGRHVAGGVEAGQGVAVKVEDLGVLVAQQAPTRTHVTRVGQHAKSGAGQRSQAHVGLWENRRSTSRAPSRPVSSWSTPVTADPLKRSIVAAKVAGSMSDVPRQSPDRVAGLQIPAGDRVLGRLPWRVLPRR